MATRNIFPHEDLSVTIVDKHQRASECSVVSVYTCIRFLSCLEEYGQLHPTSPPSPANQLSLQSLTSQLHFFYHTMKVGYDLWKTVVEERRFTCVKSKEAYTRAFLREYACNYNEDEEWIKGKTDACGSLVTKLDEGEWGNCLADFFEEEDKFNCVFFNLKKKVYERLDDIKAIESLNPDHYPTSEILDNYLLDDFDTLPHTSPLQVWQYPHIDEIFKNAPGLCALSYSEVVRPAVIVVPFLNQKDIMHSMQRVLSCFPETHSTVDRTERFPEVIPKNLQHLFAHLRHQYLRYWNQEEYDERNDVPVISLYVGLCYFVHRFLMSENPIIPTSLKTTVSQFTRELALEDPAATSFAIEFEAYPAYTPASFIQVLHSPDLMEKQKWRAFVLTRGGGSAGGVKSFSLLCDCESEEYLLFDSHGVIVEDNRVSRVTLAKNKYACLNMLLSKLSNCRLQSIAYIDVAEIRLAKEDFEKIVTNCTPFLSL